MKAITVISLGLYVTGAAFAQTLPVLEPAQAVDIRAASIQWHPHGDALLYSRAEEKGVGIGLYRLGEDEGKVLLHLGKDDRWNADWFEGSTSALVTVYRKGPREGQNEADVYLLDGKQKLSAQVFTRISSDPIHIDEELSPYLTHAIFTVTEGKQTYHLVLPTNGQHLVTSPDIDQAVKQGLSGPLWSVDGTGLFGQGLQQSISFNLSSGSGDSNGTGFTFTLGGGSGGDNGSKVQNALLGNFFKLALTNSSPPAVGTPVLEVVPSNGVLREVRFRGPWVGQPQPATELITQRHESWLESGQSRGAAMSLWLMTGKEKPVGVLVAAHADSAELAPEDKAVAYIVDGALFVRRMKGPKN